MVSGAEADGDGGCVAGPEEACAEAGCHPRCAQVLPWGTSSRSLQPSLRPGKRKRSCTLVAFSRDAASDAGKFVLCNCVMFKNTIKW